MSKIKAPLFSINAFGTLDKSITFRKKSDNQIASKYSKPGDKIPFESSPRQKDQRGIIGLITIAWQSKTDIDKSSWETLAKEAKFKGTGYHYFLHLAKTNLTTYLGLVSYWSFNYNLNGKVPDLSGNDNHGDLKPAYPSNCPQPVDSLNEKHGKALSFDGSDDFIQISPIQNLSGDITLSAWLYLYNYDDYSTIIGKRVDDDHLEFDFRVDQTSGKLWVGRGYGTGYNSYWSTSSIPLNKWVFVTFTSTNEQWRFYLDGVLDVTSPLWTDKTIQSSANVIIGMRSDYNIFFLYGFLDDMIIWNRALSQKEIQGNYRLLF